MDDFNQALSSGLQLGMQSGLRMQQLKSEAALRRLQEQRLAQELNIRLQEHAWQVQQRADQQKRAAVFEMLSTPTVPGQAEGPPTADGRFPTAQVPNPMFNPDLGANFIQAFLPGSQKPEEVLATAGSFMLHQAQAARYKRAGQTPGVGTITLPSSGEQVDYAQESDNSVRYFPKDRVAARMTERDKFQTNQKLLSEMLERDAESVPITEDADGNITVKITKDAWQKAAGGLPPAVKTGLQKKALSDDEILATAQNALRTISENPKALGPAGIAREWSERGKGFMGSDAPAPIAKARHQLALDFVKLSDSLRVDSGNMSLYERQKLESVGDPTRWVESEVTARDMMQNIQDLAVARKLRNNASLGKPHADNLIELIPEKELLPLIKSQLLTEKDAERWWKLNQKK